MATQPHDLALEILEGCGGSAAREASALGRITAASPTELRLAGSDPAAAAGLRTVVAVYTVITAPGRRPRVLLETSVQQQLAERWADVLRQRPRPRFHGVRLNAAGAETPEMQRVLTAVCEATGLPSDEEGDLLVRVRRTAAEDGWELLLRTTPRPLATRAWRTVDYPGAVNGTIAASVLDLMDVGVEDSMLDMTCGSGTFLIEQMHRGAPRRAVGVDLSQSALDAAAEHQRAARRRGRIDWLHGDVLTVPLEGGFTRILTNPPWGMLHGDHEQNQELHAALLERAAGLASPQARLGVLTQEVRRMHAVLDEPDCAWRPEREHRFFQKGHRPRLFVLALRD